jgi:hypothetical protein
MTISNVIYNQDGKASPLVSGHSYAWSSWAWGYDIDGNSIAVSMGESWGFHYNIEGAYTITASAGPHGSINPSGDVIVNQGSDKSFTITPDTGYSIADVLVDGSSVGAVSSYTFTNVTEDHTISATFSAEATGPVHNLTKGTYYNTIQAALDDADSLGGDTIEVDDGTYNESITFPANKVVILQSASGIRDNVIIQGANNFATVTTNVSSTGTTLRGFTITHTDGDTGSGIYIGNGNLIVDNCIISGNTASRGGGICNWSGTLTIIASTISSNTADDDGGGGGIYNCEGIIDITESTISGNTAYGGSGIFNGGTLTITSSTISGNTADEGGGIYNQDGTLTITSSTISGNTAASRSGGGIGNNRGTLTITSSDISGNTATYCGGGIDNSHGTLTITRSNISGNNVSRPEALFTQGGGIHNCDTLDITSSTISGNTASRGGGINNYGTLTIASSIISGNTAADDMGGGIYSSVTLTITGSTISDNTAADDGGGIFNYGTLTITGSTISGNTSDRYGGGIYLGGTGTITIGGESPADKNTICGNYKSGYDPSLDQQIRDDSGDLYETYKDTNYISAYCE